MSDLISRQAAIDAAIKADMENNSNVLSEKRARVIDRHISAVPSVQPQRNPDEWCHDCKEYDQERNCCPRFNQVIRQTLSEQTEVIRCKECINNRNCDIQYYAQAGDEFWCAAAERRTE